ncbi:MAG: helix-turn-helix domain-containing protein, partial [Candidatus Omnitrophica bacterium]|nr:helix-turn-helix domain-containing protein [Candidatus Omnitrophota bacterium]
MKDKIFSISGAAEHLGVSALTLRKWVAQAKVRAFRTPGGHRRFRKSDLDAILNYDEKAVNKLALIIKKIESLDLA